MHPAEVVITVTVILPFQMEIEVDVEEALPGIHAAILECRIGLMMSEGEREVDAKDQAVHTEPTHPVTENENKSMFLNTAELIVNPHSLIRQLSSSKAFTYLSVGLEAKLAIKTAPLSVIIVETVDQRAVIDPHR